MGNCGRNENNKLNTNKKGNIQKQLKMDSKSMIKIKKFMGKIINRKTSNYRKL